MLLTDGKCMKLETLTKWPLRILETLAVLLIAAIAIVVTGAVVLRLFKIVPAGSTELATLFFVWAIYIGMFLAFVEGGHLAITVVVNRLRGRLLTTVVIISDLLLLAFTAVVTLESVNYVMLALDSVRVTPALEISPAWMYSAVLVGMALSTLYVGGRIILNIRRLIAGEEPPAYLNEEDMVEGTQI